MAQPQAAGDLPRLVLLDLQTQIAQEGAKPDAWFSARGATRRSGSGTRACATRSTRLHEPRAATSPGSARTPSAAPTLPSGNRSAAAPSKPPRSPATVRMSDMKLPTSAGAQGAPRVRAAELEKLEPWWPRSGARFVAVHALSRLELATCQRAENVGLGMRVHDVPYAQSPKAHPAPLTKSLTPSGRRHFSLTLPR